MDLSESIKQKALEIGFDLVGITSAEPIEDRQIDYLTAWLKQGAAGRMSYMHKNFEKRINPAELLENAQSVVCVGLNYTPPPARKPPGATAPTARVANYAQYEDYHSFIKKQLRRLSGFLSSLLSQSFKFKICVDSVPLAERALAVRAGLGFIGKNHMLTNPELGSQIFLGEMITDLKLRPDRPIEADCSSCNKCITACPTAALTTDGQFDANKCISYLTIEYKDRIPIDIAEKIDDRLFGCDECVLACPYQNNAPVCKNKQFKFHSGRARLNLSEVLNLSRQDFNARFADSVIKRLGFERLRRNAEICLANVTGL